MAIRRSWAELYYERSHSTRGATFHHVTPPSDNNSFTPPSTPNKLDYSSDQKARIAKRGTI